MIYGSFGAWFQLAVSLAPFACMSDSITCSCGNDLWQFWCLFQMAVSLAPFTWMAASRTVQVAMMYGSFGGCFNWQFLWHHLHAWQIQEQVHVAMIYGSCGGCFNWQFLCHHLNAWHIPEQFMWQLYMAILVACLNCSFFGTICMHGSFQNSSCSNDLWQLWWLFQLAVSLAPFACMTISRTNHVAWSMVVLVAVSIGSFFGTICMHGSFQNSSCGNDLWQFWWLFQLAVSLAPFACMAISRTVHVAWSMAVLVAVSIGSFFGTICMHGSF